MHSGQFGHLEVVQPLLLLLVEVLDVVAPAAPPWLGSAAGISPSHAPAATTTAIPRAAMLATHLMEPGYHLTPLGLSVPVTGAASGLAPRQNRWGCVPMCRQGVIEPGEDKPSAPTSITPWERKCLFAGRR